jgi:hypothetical protein
VDEVDDLNTGLVYGRKTCVIKKKDEKRLELIFTNELKVIQPLEKSKQYRYIICIYATYTTVNTLAMLLDPVADGGDLGEYSLNTPHYTTVHNMQWRQIPWLKASNKHSVARRGASLSCISTAFDTKTSRLGTFWSIVTESFMPTSASRSTRAREIVARLLYQQA